MRLNQRAFDIQDAVLGFTLAILAALKHTTRPFQSSLPYASLKSDTNVSNVSNGFFDMNGKLFTISSDERMDQ